MSVFFRMPQTARDNAANFVFWKLANDIAMLNWAASFSIIFRVTSGVMSRSLNPVPPVVTNKCTFRLSHIRSNSFYLMKKKQVKSRSKNIYIKCLPQFYRSHPKQENLSLNHLNVSQLNCVAIDHFYQHIHRLNSDH